MEADIEHLPSDLFDNVLFQEQLAIIKQASDDAQKELDYESAHNDDILLAISIIERFLRKTHRICYGGQAINAYLPKQYKFYDPEYNVPDYDFFTPDQKHDIDLIEAKLMDAGFTEISIREGMHEGTLKVYVNYNPVADLTAMDPGLYKILSRRASRFNGISYLDANSLRMLMHLELSRPRGEVGRWTKVFERLMIFNEFAPIKDCRIPKTTALMKQCLTIEEVQYLLHYILVEERVFAGGDLLQLYDNSFSSSKEEWVLSHRRPIIFLSNDADKDVKQILAQLKPTRPHIRIKTYSHKGLDLLPSIHVIHQGKQPLVLIVQQSACHSYYVLTMERNRKIKIASMDTLITLYFGLAYVKSPYFTTRSLDCLANHLVHLSIKARKDPAEFRFPFISIQCVGHQTTLPSLIRSKVQRLLLKRQLDTRKVKNALSKTGKKHRGKTRVKRRH